MRRRFHFSAKPLLYLVTDWRNFDEDGLIKHVDACIQGGVDVVQYRDKVSSDEKFLRVAQKLKDLTDKHDIALVINDRLAIAGIVKPDAVHVGKNDPRPVQIREKLVGEHTIVGYSITSEDGPDYACPTETDYAGVGPVFSTKTKRDAAPEMGLEGLREACRKCGLPVIAIGGITSSNAKQVIEAGALGVAVIGELMDAKDPKAKATELKGIISSARRTWSSL